MNYPIRLALCVSLCMLFSLPPLSGQQDQNGRARIRAALTLSRRIDSKLKFRRNIPVGEVAGDGEFLRRITLDLVGTIPTAEVARKFCLDRSETKRRDVIDALLATDAFANLWSRIWCEILLGNYRDLNARFQGKRLEKKVVNESFRRFQAWLQERISRDDPWPLIVVEMLQATGMLTENPPLFYKASHFRQGSFPLTFADDMSRALLGMQISCARCHDHPFDRWSQEDYYGLAAFMARTRVTAVGGKTDRVCDDGEFGEAAKGELTMPTTKKVIGAQFLFGGKAGSKDLRMPMLARYMATARNTQLARNVVNRTWKWLMGRGFVEPVDDFNQMNRPVHSSVMENIRREFARNRYSLKFLFRAICNSESYQRECGWTTEPFASAALRPMTGEQLFKAITTATLSSDNPPDFESRKMRLLWGKYLKNLPGIFGAGKPWTEVTVLPANTRQVLLLRNGTLVRDLVSSSKGLLGRIRGSKSLPEEKLEEIFLAILTRFPTEDEIDRYLWFVEDAESERSAWEDVSWTLLNSAEFSLRH